MYVSNHSIRTACWLAVKCNAPPKGTVWNARQRRKHIPQRFSKNCRCTTIMALQNSKKKQSAKVQASQVVCVNKARRLTEATRRKSRRLRLTDCSPRLLSQVALSDCSLPDCSLPDCSLRLLSQIALLYCSPRLLSQIALSDCSLRLLSPRLLSQTALPDCSPRLLSPRLLSWTALPD